MSNRWSRIRSSRRTVMCNQSLHDGSERSMEFASIEREIHVQAAPEVVFACRQPAGAPPGVGGPDNATLESATPGASGELIWGDEDNPRAHVEAMTVVEADPPRRFVFRWTHQAGEEAAPGNSLLVTFELTPSGGGTLLRMTETASARWAGRPRSWRRRTTSTSRAGTTSSRGCRRTPTAWSRARDRRDRRRPSGRRSATRPAAGCSTCC